jgi:hypothetical protein
MFSSMIKEEIDEESEIKSWFLLTMKHKVPKSTPLETLVPLVMDLHKGLPTGHLFFERIF